MALQPDRFISLMLRKFGSLPRTTKHKRIPILMYHDIDDTLMSPQLPYFETVVTPAVFKNQLALLKVSRYRVCPLQDIIAMDFEQTAQARVIITFDDAFASVYTTGFPLLMEHGFTATVFVPTAFIGAASPGLEGKAHMTWQQMREMQKYGFEFGSHSRDHILLATAPDETVKQQFYASRAAIEDHLGTRVLSFAYPYAFPEQNRERVAFFREQLINAGYQYGVTTRLGCTSRSDDIYFLKRLPVNDFDDPLLFNAKLEGFYDWLYPVQRVVKAVKRVVKG